MSATPNAPNMVAVAVPPLHGQGKTNTQGGASTPPDTAMQVGRANRKLEDASTIPNKAPTRVIAPEVAPEALLNLKQLSNGFRNLVEQAKLDRAWAAQIEQVLQQHFGEMPTLKDIAAGAASASRRSKMAVRYLRVRTWIRRRSST